MLWFAPVFALVLYVGIVLNTAWHVQPWAPFWFGGGAVQTVDVGDDVARAAPIESLPLAPAPVATSGRVTDAERYALARGAGFSLTDAITAAAISMAEDGSGDPAALSPKNFDGSRDLGLWQINSGWWAQFGGQAALEVPANNAHAAVVIFGRQGWCAWSVYEAKCGPGHTGAYAANLGRARAAAGQ